MKSYALLLIALKLNLKWKTFINRPQYDNMNQNHFEFLRLKRVFITISVGFESYLSHDSLSTSSILYCSSLMMDWALLPAMNLIYKSPIKGT
jgi:hypothetical protein